MAENQEKPGLSGYYIAGESYQITEEENKAGLLYSTLYRWTDWKHDVAHVLIEEFESGWISCSNLVVAEELRGIGCGDDIMKFCIEMGVNNLSVDRDNSIAISLYKKYGFEFTGGTDGDLLRMERKAKEIK